MGLYYSCTKIYLWGIYYADALCTGDVTLGPSLSGYSPSYGRIAEVGVQHLPVGENPPGDAQGCRRFLFGPRRSSAT